MSILVTGGAGYIGSHTIVELQNRDYVPVSIDNFSNSTTNTYSNIKRITQKDIEHFNIDLVDQEKVKQFFKEHQNIEGVIHFAAFKAVGESVENPVKYYRNNIISLLNILDHIEEHQIKNFIFSSSCSVYGNIDTLPVSEQTALNATESPYAETKKMCERIIQDFYATNKNLNAIILRYFNPVGAHESGIIGELPLQRPNNLVPLITRTAAGLENELNVFGTDYNTRDGSCIRDYIHVSDIAEAHVLSLDFCNNSSKESNCEIFNLGSGKGVSVLEMIDAFEAATQKKVIFKKAPRRSGDVEAIYSDCSKAKNLLNWTPKYNLDEMMRSAWKWQQQLN